MGRAQREASAALPAQQLQHAGTARVQRIGEGGRQLRPDAPADHRRRREEPNPHHQRLAQLCQSL